MHGEAIDDELTESLEGRTINRALMFDASPKSEWTHHETFWLWLDDGRVIEFSSWGYDADGATITEIEVINVEQCLHCSKPHPDSQVFYKDAVDTPVERLRGGRYTYCTNGNNIAWRESVHA